MKTMKAAIAILSLAGNMGFTTASAAGVPGLISKDALAAGDYCHLKFAAIREETLGSPYPVLKDANEGDIVDFYGSCNHDRSSSTAPPTAASLLSWSSLFFPPFWPVNGLCPLD